MSIIDTHAHLNVSDFDIDREAVITRAGDSGVTTIVTVGTDVVSSQQALTLAEKYPRVYVAVGIHPNDAGKAKEADIARLSEMAMHPKVVAIGEIGLDFYRNYSPREAQFQFLRRQLELASQMSLPVIIHARQSTGEIMAVLTGWVKSRVAVSVPPGVIHCFSGDIQVARQYLNLGFYLGFGGYVSYPRSHVPAMIRDLPRDRILVETDCPYLPPQKYRGQRNEPSYITFAVAVIAQALEMTPEAVGEMTTENANRLFKFQ